MNDHLPDQLSLTPAELAVLISGTTSMGLEIVAGRIIAPEFGNSIYTWGSIIGVFMAALSLGYYIGGKRSDHADIGTLSTILLKTATYVAALMLTHELILAAAGTLPVPARYASIIPVTILFGPPVYILGLLTPYATQLSKEMSKGEASGRIFAIGTIGSIAGTFLTTFALIPYLSVQQIFLLWGAVLVIGAVIVKKPDLVERKLFVLLIAGLLIGSFGLNTSIPRIDGERVYHTQTAYQELEVVDADGVRTLYLDGQPNSAMYLDGRQEYVFGYTPYFHLPFLLEDNIDDVLFIGGGGFSGPKRFLDEYSNVSVDVVEIDPQVVDAARKYFNVTDDPRMETHVMDGREYIDQTDNSYDIIILDAYKKDKVPFHLTTREFFQLVHDSLENDGIVLSNLIATPTGPGSEFFRAEYRTIDAVFQNVQAFKTTDSSFAQNIEVIAWKDGEELSTTEWQQRNRQRDIGINLSEQIGYRIETIPTDDVPLLRDGKAPVDRLLDPLLGQEYVTGQE